MSSKSRGVRFEIHPSYFEAKRKLNALADKYPKMRQMTVYIGQKWDDLLEKDPTGRQCILWVEDLEAQLTPLRCGNNSGKY